MKRSVFAKIATLALALVLVLSLAACGKKSDSGVKILGPNDTTNEARALLLLQENGIITLKDGITAASNATVQDIDSYNVLRLCGNGYLYLVLLYDINVYLHVNSLNNE